MKKIGTRLKLDFEAKAAIDGEKQVGRFCDWIAGPTIVSVYMRNNTSSCDKQMIALSEVYPRLQALGFEAIGLSKDTAGSHLKYAAKHGIAFPLVSDPEHAFANATDSLVEKKMYGRTFFGPSRSAYLIDGDGVLRGAIPYVDAANHGEEVHEFVQGLAKD